MSSFGQLFMTQIKHKAHCLHLLEKNNQGNIGKKYLYAYKVAKIGHQGALKSEKMSKMTFLK